MQSWFQVVQPYEFIEELGKREELLVADLGDVISGIAHPIYKDPELFVRTTYFTPGLLRLLQRVQSKINSGVGNGVIRVQNFFGGGKTHSLIALYHFLHNHENLFSFLPNTVLPNDISVVSITGTHLNPLKGRKIKDLKIRTIWGEIAYQIAGSEGLELLKENDRKRISPGKEILRTLFKEKKPHVILLDEITEYLAKARGVSVNESNLATQTLIFIQELTECITTLSKSILVISLPDIEYEEVKNSNKTALIEISQIISRLASSEVPSEPGDLYQIIHHKLIKQVKLPTEVTRIVKEFSDYYLLHKNDFPGFAVEPNYKSLMKQSYPFHPSLIDLLYNNWNEISTFQGTRTILSLLSQILLTLSSTGSETPIILPSDIDLKERKMRDAIFHHLPAEFSNILNIELKSEPSPSQGKDFDLRWKETFEIIVQTIFLASSQYKSENCGLYLQDINLTTWKPNLSTAFTTEVLNTLIYSSKYLHIHQNRYYYSDQLNFNSKINQMKSQYRKKALQQIIHEIGSIFQDGYLETIVWPKSHAEVADSEVLKLVLLPPNLDKDNIRDNWIHYKGNKFRLYKNTVLFGLPDEKNIEDILDILQLRFALQEYLTMYKEDPLHDPMELKSIKERIEEINARVQYVIKRTYLEFYDWKDSYQLQILKNGQDAFSESLLLELLRNDIITSEIHPIFIVDKLFDENRIISLHSLKYQFLKNERLPKLLSINVLEQALIQGVKEGIFALITLNHDNDQPYTYICQKEIKIGDIEFVETVFITNKKKEEVTDNFEEIPGEGAKTLKNGKTLKKDDKNDSHSIPSDLILQFKEINPEFYSSIQQGIIKPLYEKAKELRIDLTIQIQDPDSLEDEFLISRIKDTTDQLGGTIHKKKDQMKKEFEKDR